jgi:putative membrane protein
MTPLLDHGPAASRRRYTRALTVPILLAVALVVAVVLTDLPAPLLAFAPILVLAGAGLGYDRSRGLGHALLPAHLVARCGSLTRRRVVLDSPAIIGWTISSTWAQRRVALTSVIATMAGGPQSVTVHHVPVATGTAHARAPVPGLVEQFLV